MSGERRMEIERGIATLRGRGICWAEWARRHGFSPNTVREVRSGRSKCSRGEAFRVAEALRGVTVIEECKPSLKGMRPWLHAQADQLCPPLDALLGDLQGTLERSSPAALFRWGFACGLHEGLTKLGVRDKAILEDLLEESRLRASDLELALVVLVGFCEAAVSRVKSEFRQEWPEVLKSAHRAIGDARRT